MVWLRPRAIASSSPSECNPLKFYGALCSFRSLLVNLAKNEFHKTSLLFSSITDNRSGSNHNKMPPFVNLELNTGIAFRTGKFRRPSGFKCRQQSKTPSSTGLRNIEESARLVACTPWLSSSKLTGLSLLGDVAVLLPAVFPTTTLTEK